MADKIEKMRAQAAWCLDQAKATRDPIARATFEEAAKTWLRAAEELAREASNEDTIKQKKTGRE